MAMNVAPVRWVRQPIVVVGLVAAAGLLFVAITFVGGTIPGCALAAAGTIIERSDFVPAGDQRGPFKADEPLDPEGLGLQLPPNAAAAPKALGATNLVFARTGDGYLVLFYLDRPIDATMTTTDFYTSGGIRIEETPITSAEAQSFAKDIVGASGGRALAMPVGPYAGALIWADPSKAVNVRTHNLYWSDGNTAFSLIALMGPEDVVNLGRAVVCGSK